MVLSWIMPLPILAPRHRLWLIAGGLAVIALGLASRRFPWLFPEFLGKYPGDALWAWVVFLAWAFCLPAATTARLALLAVLTACGVEFSQLLHSPWLDAVRRTTVGHLVLGTTFSWCDLIAYAIGIALGAGLDHRLTRSSREPSPPRPSPEAMPP